MIPIHYICVPGPKPYLWSRYLCISDHVIPISELISGTSLRLVPIGTYGSLSHVWIYFIDEMVHFRCLTIQSIAYLQPRNICSQPTSGGPWRSGKYPRSADVGWPMSNVANRVSAGPSIMEWMAEHYVTHLWLFIGSTTIYSSKYSTAIDWIWRMIGISDLGGASSLMFVKDGVTSSTHAHSTWIYILNAQMALPYWIC